MSTHVNAIAAYVHANLTWALGRVGARLARSEGQGTVEYVGLILLVSLLMAGMVAAMKGFNGQQGMELAETIVKKIKSAVDKVSFR